MFTIKDFIYWFVASILLGIFASTSFFSITGFTLAAVAWSFFWNGLHLVFDLKSSKSMRSHQVIETCIYIASGTALAAVLCIVPFGFLFGPAVAIALLSMSFLWIMLTFYNIYKSIKIG